MRNFLKTMAVLMVLCVSAFTQEVNFNVQPTSEDLFNFATMGRPMMSNGFIKRAKVMSEFVASIDENSITYEYMRAIKKEAVAKTWFGESALLSGIGLGLYLGSLGYLDSGNESEAVGMMIAGGACYILGFTGIIISGIALQKATLRKDLLIRRIPVALKQISVGGTTTSATWVFGKTKNHLYTDGMNSVREF
jgi:hypothetical protein